MYSSFNRTKNLQVFGLMPKYQTRKKKENFMAIPAKNI